MKLRFSSTIPLPPITLSKPTPSSLESMTMIKFLLCITAVVAGVAGRDEELVHLFLDATPKHPLIRTPDVLLEESTQSKITHNESYGANFYPFNECSENKTNLKIGDFGTITTPNYPSNYPARLSCEWRIEGPPGSKIQGVFFDIVTQPWFFAYFDYILVSKDGTFNTVDRLSGDLNGKTPLVVTSDENALGLRFRSSSLFNFRGFKFQYLVIPADENVTPIEPPVFNGICGQSAYMDTGVTTASSMMTTEEMMTTMGLSSTANTPAESDTSDFPIIAPGDSDPSATEEGRRKAPPDQHIVGGAEALKYSYPWMAALLIDKRHFCGGSLISDQYIMTAAHCTDNAKEITILLGTHNIKASKDVEDGRKIINITSSDIFQHPDYNENTITHDISILKLPEPITFTDRIRPVCLPNRFFLTRFFVDEPSVVSGWGKNSDNAAGVNPTLKEADVNVLANKPCRNFFRGIITGNQICIDAKPDASPCKGDSGGPLMVTRSGPLGPYKMIIGIVSFGSMTCERGLPVGFTRTTAFIDYINQVTGFNL